MPEKKRPKLAEVHLNKDKTLVVIAPLIEKSFGVKFPTGVGSNCLSTAVIRSISAVTSIPAQVIADTFIDAPNTSLGYTMLELFNHFDRTIIKYNNKKYMVSLELAEFKDEQRILNQIRTGQPVLMIIKAYDPFHWALDELEEQYNNPDDDPEFQTESKDGIIDELAICNTDPLNRQYGQDYHAMLLVGHDIPNKMVVGQDTKSNYAYGGYFKFATKFLNKRFAKYFTVVVKDFRSM